MLCTVVSFTVLGFPGSVSVGLPSGKTGSSIVPAMKGALDENALFSSNSARDRLRLSWCSIGPVVAVALTPPCIDSTS